MAVMKTVSIDRAAEILQVSRRTIYNHIRRGYLQTIRTIGGHSQRVTLESLALLQGTGRRRGERFFAPPSTPPPDVVNHLNEQSVEFLSRQTPLRSAQDLVETANRFRVLRADFRVAKVVRGDIRGDR
jgi:excisionase family DNA binding protein